MPRRCGSARFGLEMLGEGLAELGHLRPHHESAVALVGMLEVVILVVILGRPVAFKRLHFGHHGRPEELLAIHAGDQLLGHGTVGRVGEVDAAAVLRAHVVALAVERGRVVGAEEDLEDLAHADHLRIERELHHLRMAGLARADLLIGGRRHLAVGIAALHVGHAAHAVENGFRAPETTTTQSNGFNLRNLLIFHNIYLSGCFVSFDKTVKSALQFGRNLPKIGACRCLPYRVE